MFKKVAVLVCMLCSGTAAALAQDQSASSGFSAQGTVAGQMLIGGMNLNLGADIALLGRGQQFRVDVSHLAVPGSGATVNALLQQFLPQGSFTVVLDRAAKTTTLWSTEKRMYYVMSPGSTTTSDAARVPPNPANAGSLLGMLKSIKDYSVYELSARLGPKGNVNGHPVTTLQYSIRMQKRGGPLSTMSGDVALADDEQGLPVRATAALQGRNIKGSVRLDFRTLSATAPDPSSFTVPAGFTQTNDPSQIFGNLGSSRLNP